MTLSSIVGPSAEVVSREGSALGASMPSLMPSTQISAGPSIGFMPMQPNSPLEQVLGGGAEVHGNRNGQLTNAVAGGMIMAGIFTLLDKITEPVPPPTQEQIKAAAYAEDEKRKAEFAKEEARKAYFANKR